MLANYQNITERFANCASVYKERERFLLCRPDKIFAQSGRRKNYAEPGGEPTLRFVCRIKTRRLTPPRRMTPSRSAGRGTDIQSFQRNIIIFLSFLCKRSCDVKYKSQLPL